MRTGCRTFWLNASLSKPVFWACSLVVSWKSVVNNLVRLIHFAIVFQGALCAMLFPSVGHYRHHNYGPVHSPVQAKFGARDPVMTQFRQFFRSQSFRACMKRNDTRVKPRMSPSCRERPQIRAVVKVLGPPHIINLKALNQCVVPTSSACCLKVLRYRAYASHLLNHVQVATSWRLFIRVARIPEDTVRDCPGGC